MRGKPLVAAIFLNRQQYALESLKNRLQADKCCAFSKAKSNGAGGMLTKANAFGVAAFAECTLANDF